MDNRITLEDVLSYSEGFDFSKAGYLTPITALFIALLLIGLALILKNKENTALVATGMVLCLGSIVFGTVEANKMTPETTQAYTTAVATWEKEIAGVYYEQLPFRQITQIEKVHYDRQLEKSSKDGKGNLPPELKGETPIRLTAKDGEVVSVWAVVKNEVPFGANAYLTFKYVPVELAFEKNHIPFKEKGYYEATYYTKDKIKGEQ